MRLRTQLKLLAAAMMFAGGFNVTFAADSATTQAKPMSSKLGAVSQSRLNGASSDKASWLHPNGDYAQTRYHAATQITAGNVAKLRPAFVFQTAVTESMETAPLIIDGVMFL